MALENKYLVESFDPEVLREYDIRGIVGNNLNNNTAYTIGRTFGQIVQKKITGETIECIGPEIISLKEIIQKLLKLIGKKRLLIPVPLFIAKLSAIFI